MEKPRRIGIEAQRLFRAQKHGMDIVVLNLLLELQKLDTYNEYFVFVKPGPDISCLPPQKNFTVVEVSGFTYFDWEQVFLPLAIKKHRLDSVHFTANTAPVFCSTPSILTLHDIIFLERKGKDVFGGSLYQKLGTIYRKLIVPKAVAKASKIVTISATERNNILTVFSQIEHKIDVVYNGLDSNFFALPFTSQSVVQSLKLPERYMFAVGNTDPRKNTKRLLEAYCAYVEQQATPLQLVLIGYPKRLVVQQLKERNKMDILPFIHCLSYISAAELPFIYSMARFFVFPSLREGFGLPPLEAMARHVPVIASKLSSIPEICGNGAYYINPNNTAELVAAFNILDSNNELRKELIDKGVARANEFSWSKTAKSFYTYYQAI